MLVFLIQFQPLQLSCMQPKKENQLFIFEDDEQIIQVPAPREKPSTQHQSRIESVLLNDQSANGTNLHENYDQIISPNFNSLPSHLNKHQKNQDQVTPAEQQEHKASNIVFMQQNAYSFRKNGLEQPQKVKYKQISNEMELISEFHSQISKNQSFTQGKQQDTRGLSRKNERRRNKNKSKFQDINDSSSVTSSKFADKVQNFKEPQKMVPNFLSQMPDKEVEAEYHKTEDHLTHHKKDQDEIIQSITGIGKNKKQDKMLPPIQPHKPGQIFINTSGILQNQTSMVALNKKQEVNKLQMTNMSSITQLFHTNQNEKTKKIAQKIVPLSKTFKCTFQRQKICCLNYWHPQYSFHFKNQKRILNGKKQCGKINSRYNISSEQRVYDGDCDGFLGYLSGNFFGTCFNLYQKIDDKQELVCTIAYEIEFKCSSAFRKIEVFVKNEQYPSQSLYKGPIDKDYNLKQLYDMGQNAKQNKIFKLVNKKPEWCDTQNCYSMNFKGKCKMASVKNKVLIAQNDPNRYILLFCKTDHDTFCTQISYPLSPFIAMGIILSSFDFKLFCQ